MELKQFEVKGQYQELQKWKPYTKVLAAPNEKQAEERIYNIIGSKHRLKRLYIKINTITECKGE
ncbi:MAG: 50S ribosomal protein L18a [Methanomicrobiales archaeon HGW-Methanomicrobiales-4]|nr:MAG: 50S ribosomal protein L18a [Methanomicrobiales archaeon HGW-Methanomicrobiales-4]